MGSDLRSTAGQRTGALFRRAGPAGLAGLLALAIPVVAGATRVRAPSRVVLAAAALCANTQLQPTPENLAQIETATLCLINAERAARGEAALRSNADLRGTAQRHSEAMLRHNYFGHVSPGGSTPETRIQASGYVGSQVTEWGVAENVGWGPTGGATPAAAVAKWMASPPHRANILTAAYRDTGIGVVARLPACLRAGSVGAVYTEDFGYTN